MDISGPLLWLDMFIKDLDDLVLYVLAGASAINLVLALSLLILGCIFKQDTPGSSTNFYIAFGGMAMVACVIILGLDPEWMTTHIMESFCQCYPTILCFGLAAFIGGLLVRAGTIFSFYKAGSPRKMHKQEWKPNMWMLFLLIIEAAPMLVWVLLFDLRGVEKVDEDAVTYVECTSEEYDWWRIGLSAYHALLILLAAIFVWPAIYYSKKTVSSVDANLVCAAVYNMLLAVAAAVVVVILYDTSDTNKYAICGGILQYVVFLTLGLLIAAKLCVARKLRGSDGDGPYSQMDGHGEKGGYSNEAHQEDNTYVNDSPPQSHIAETFSY